MARATSRLNAPTTPRRRTRTLLPKPRTGLLVRAPSAVALAITVCITLLARTLLALEVTVRVETKVVEVAVAKVTDHPKVARVTGAVAVTLQVHASSGSSLVGAGMVISASSYTTTRARARPSSARRPKEEKTVQVLLTVVKLRRMLQMLPCWWTQDRQSEQECCASIAELRRDLQNHWSTSVDSSFL